MMRKENKPSTRRLLYDRELDLWGIRNSPQGRKYDFLWYASETRRQRQLRLAQYRGGDPEIYLEQ